MNSALDRSISSIVICTLSLLCLASPASAQDHGEHDEHGDHEGHDHDAQQEPQEEQDQPEPEEGDDSGDSNSSDDTDNADNSDDSSGEIDPFAPPLDTSPRDPLADSLAREAAKEDEKKNPPKKEKDGEYDLGSDDILGVEMEEAEPGSRFRVEIGQLRDLPFKNAADVMELAPSVLTTNHGGDGHAHETFMRGFFAGEGQDIEYMVDGVPLNEIGNAHGHGYTDLFFILPTFIQTLTVTEGSFDPEQGDFAVAGSVDFELGQTRRGIFAEVGYGIWDTRRLSLTYAPEGQNTGTFSGVEFHQTDGFGENRGAQRVTAMSRYASDSGGNGLRWAATIFGYSSRYDQPGVLRIADVESGAIDYYGTYDPNQGGTSRRVLTTLTMKAGPSEALFDQVLWFGVRQMRLRQNFTGFLTPVTDEDGSTNFPGDLQEGRYQVLTIGGRGSYTVGRMVGGLGQQFSLGYSARYDRGTTELVTLRNRLQIPYQRDFDRQLDVTNIAGWMRAQIQPLEDLRVSGGVRLDAFGFGVRDRNFPAGDTEGERLTEQTVEAFGVAVNPRATASYGITDHVSALVSLGQGTRSTDPAALSDSETAPFATSNQADAGLKYERQATEENPWTLSGQLGYVYARVTQDQVFSPAAGRNILVGASQRHAGLLTARATYKDRFDVLANMAYTRATTIDVDDASPTFGQEVLLPYVPRFIGRLDTTYNHPMPFEVKGEAVSGRVGASFSYVPGRPLPFNTFGDPFYLLDLSAGVSVWRATLDLQVRNALNRQYAQSEFNYPSRFDRNQPLPSSGSLPPARHIVAGDPFFMMLNLRLDVGAFFEPPEG